MAMTKQNPAAATRRVIGEQLGHMLGCFPNGGPESIPAAEAYLKELFEAVIDLEPSPAVLAAACRHLIRTQIFFPTIAEILRAIREQQRLMGERR
jgi:hypothetical protein